MAAIKPVDRVSVRRLCSGQVILNLANAVKELVENSLDAGATIIEIRLREYGSELIEVCDNGSGISPADHESVTQRHHTSKIRTFSDVKGVESFGFRGEALNSLCCISELTITTRTMEQRVGSKLTFDDGGKLLESTNCARGPGTSVSVSGIFKPLPVRHKELLRNLKREYTKLLQILQAYALISTDIRIVCSNQLGEGARKNIFATSSDGSLMKNASALFGARVANKLVEVDISIPCGGRIVGLISKDQQAAGWSTERQFTYLNGRPVDMPKISQTLNSAFRSSSTLAGPSGRPMAILHLMIPHDTTDVNVSPDKRKVFIENEADVIRALQEGVLEVWSANQQTYQRKYLSQQSANSSEDQLLSPGDVKYIGNDDTTCLGSQEEHAAVDEKDADDYLGTLTPTSPGAVDRYQHGASVQESSTQITPAKRTIGMIKDEQTQHGAEGMDESPAKRRAAESTLDEFYEKPSQDTGEERELLSNQESWNQITEAEPMTQRENFEEMRRSGGDLEIDSEKTESNLEPIYAGGGGLTPQRSHAEISQPPGSQPSGVDYVVKSEVATDIPDNGPEEAVSIMPVSLLEHVEGPSILGPEVGPTKDSEGNLSIAVNLEELRHCWEEYTKQHNADDEVRQSQMSSPKFSSASFQDSEKLNAISNEDATAELKRVFQKENFGQLQVIGQFNLGFILAKLGEDIFIVDQHASDERTTFEKLLKSTVISRQPLVCPAALNLSVVEESVVRMHMSIFQKNGFSFVDDPKTGRLKLSSIPISKMTSFGPDDVAELAVQIQGGVHKSVAVGRDSAPQKEITENIPRPTRVMSMLAMRACRSSIMIGKFLHRKQMETVLKNLSMLDAPWNCAHGRPTFRHLCVLPDGHQ